MMDLEGTQEDYFEMPGCGVSKGGMAIGSDDLAERGDHWRALAMQEKEARIKAQKELNDFLNDDPLGLRT
jgi:hypothetical protein